MTHDAGSSQVAVDQTQRAGEWVSLGTFSFLAGDDSAITLTDDASGTVVADAVKLVRDNTSETDTEAKDLTYTYDVNGNLVEIVDQSSGSNVDTYQVSYDGLNRVAQVEELLAGVVQNTTSFTYNQVGAPLTRTHDDSHANFTYDARNLLTTVTNGDTPSDPAPKTTTYTHTPRGQRATETKANGNTVSFDHWPDGALREQVETKPEATVVASHVYEYDLNGNRSLDTSRQMNADNHADYLERVSSFGYDPRDRLAQVTRTDPGTGQQAGSETYRHDANNNVISQTIDGITTDSAYDRNRLQSTTTTGVVSSYNYDPFGRLNSVTAAGQVAQRYVYDGFDRIVEQLTDGATTRKSYDPLDRTATQTTDAGALEEQTTEFVYLGLSERVLAEIVDGEVQTTYQHGITGQLLSQTKHQPGGAEEDSFYEYNPHGDITGITDQTGNSRATYGYTAYGRDDQSLFTGVDKPDPGNPEAQEPYNVYRYAGQRFDHGTGTYDMGFRDYDPGLNRFLTRDTFNGALADLYLTTDPWSLGRYTFAGGNPTTLVEYDGHFAVRDVVGGGASGGSGDNRSGWDKLGEFVVGFQHGWDNWGMDKAEGIAAFIDDPVGAFESMVDEANYWSIKYTHQPISVAPSGNIGWVCVLTGVCEIYERWRAGDYYGAGYATGGLAGDVTVGAAAAVASGGAGAIVGATTRGASAALRALKPNRPTVRKGSNPNEVPGNLAEQMALDAARASNPQARIIMRNLGDEPRLVDNYGPGEWVKMQYVLRGADSNVTVHWFRNLTTGANVEYKFTNRYPPPSRYR